MRTARLLAPIIVVIAAAGCGGGAETPTAPTSTSIEPTSILFSGTLQPRATRFYSYSVTTGGTVTAMLASLERGTSPMPNALELGLGVPAGTGCAVLTTSMTTTALVPQLRQEVTTGTYCVRISDAEGLPAAMNFTIRVVHP